MIIGHLPAGYLLAHVVHQCHSVAKVTNRKLVLFAALIGSIFPDIDLLYFYLVDHRAHHHHTYWTHLPVFWLVLFALVLATLAATGRRRAFTLCGVFALSIALHLMLDSIVGDIWWLYPFIDKPYALFTVAPSQTAWLLSFVLHWSFLLELGVALVASRVFLRRHRGKTNARAHVQSD